MSNRLRALGYSVEEARIGEVLAVRYQSPAGRMWVTGKNMVYPMNNRFIHQITSDKQHSYELAELLGIVTPTSLYVRRHEPVDGHIEAFLHEYGRVIVKPLDSYKSHGVSLNVTTPDDLHEALEVAFCESSTAIIQEQVEGEEYRFTVLEGKVVSVLRRERPRIIGDGVNTISQLVEWKNDLRLRNMPEDVNYPEWTPNLIGDVVLSDEILPPGEKRVLAHTTLISKGAWVYELVDETDSSYKQIAEQFATELGAGLCAIDMFIADEKTPAAKGRYWFNEANASPSLKMYAAPLNADSRWVADAIVEATDRHLNKNI